MELEANMPLSQSVNEEGMMNWEPRETGRSTDGGHWITAPPWRLGRACLEYRESRGPQ